MILVSMAMAELLGIIRLILKMITFQSTQTRTLRRPIGLMNNNAKIWISQRNIGMIQSSTLPSKPLFLTPTLPLSVSKI